MMKKLFRLSPIFRISIGVISLMLSLVLAFDSLFDMLPNERAQQIALRKDISRIISVQLGDAVAAGDPFRLQRAVDRIATYYPEIASTGIRRADRVLLAASSGHAARWIAPAPGLATVTHIVVPLWINKSRWGDVEFAFTEPNVALGWIRQPSVMFLLLFSSIGLLGVHLYLRRALHSMDTSNAVPQRVRKAFDTLTEGVLLLSPKGQILLVNSAFEQMNTGGIEHITGSAISEVQWLIDGLSDLSQHDGYPWEMAVRTNQTLGGRRITLKLPSGKSRELMMNCSAIDDGSGVARGCLVTFDDVTELSEANARLQRTMLELEASRDTIQAQNIELQNHANLDPLTGCYNRRAFFSRAEPLYQAAATNQEILYCIMGDIDHFKSFNDKYGHAIGDAVIQAVVAAIKRSLRNEDLLCRYGGEEFCILVGGEKGDGMEVAERIRARIETECGPGIRSVEGLQIRSSFGVALLSDLAPRSSSLTDLINAADEALYVSKNTGRNRVSRAPRQQELTIQ